MVSVYVLCSAKRLILISLGVAALAEKILFIIIINSLECMNCKIHNVYIQEDKWVNTFMNIEEITKQRSVQLCVVLSF